MDTQALADIQAIRTLKARYCILLDSEQWESWAELFAPDVAIDISDELKEGMGDPIVRGRDKMIAQTKAIMTGSISMHMVHEPDIELTSPTTAKAIWPMNDRTEFPEGVKSPGPFRLVTGLGYYHETYEKVDGSWRIKTQKLVRKHKAFV